MPLRLIFIVISFKFSVALVRRSAAFEGTQVWTDDQTGLVQCTRGSTTSCNGGDMTAVNAGGSLIAVGFTVPNDGIPVDYYITTFSFGLCASNAGAFAANTMQYSLSLYDSIVSPSTGLVTPSGSAIATVPSTNTVGVAASQGTYVTATLPTTWAVSYNASGPYYFITIQLAGTGGGLLCPASTNANGGKIWQADAWEITGIGALATGTATYASGAAIASFVPRDFLFGNGAAPPYNPGIRITGTEFSESQTTTPSPTQSPSPTPTPSLTQSGTATITQTASQTQTQTRSVTQSASQKTTQTRSSTPSGTLTSTVSQTTSPSLTPSLTRSMTQSLSKGASESQTITQAASWTASITQTGTLTSTRSITQTGTLTSTLTGAVTPSGTQTVTQTTTATQSHSQTQPVTPSTSQTASLTQSVSVSETRSSSATPTPSTTGTPSPSLTPSATVTVSLTQSASLTQLYTPSATLTVSSPSTESQTCTPSQTQTVSESGTRSCTQTLSLTETASPTSTPSVTALLESPTMSTSMSQMQSGTLSSSLAPSLSQSTTPSVLITQASTGSATASPSVSSTASVSMTPTMTASPSQTATQTRTPSSSREPYALLFSSASLPFPSSASGVAGALAVSDSLVTTPVAFALSRCPTDGGGVLAANLVCSLSPAGPLAPLNSSFTDTPSVALFQTLSSSSSAPVSVGPVPCNPSSDAPVSLGLSIAMGAFFGTGSGTGTLICRLTSTTLASEGRTLAIGTQPLSVTASLWPLWGDAILVTDLGIMRSPRLGRSLNGTQQLLIISRSSDVTAAVRNISAVLAAVQSLWANVSLRALSLTSSGDAADATFSMTLTGSTIVVLRAAQTQDQSQARPSFRAGTTAKLGTGSCTGMAVSDDGRWMVLRTPPANFTCAEGSASATSSDCGYVTLTINTSAAEGLRTDSLGVALQCPPFCPGALSLSRSYGSGGSGAAVPIPLSDGMFGFAINPAAVGSAAPPTALSWTRSVSSSSAGIYYALACAQSGLYTDPTTGACSNASDPTSNNCAYGAGELCQLCPISALCPGGFRMWSRAGFWAAYDTTGNVLPCAAPNPEARCTGWNVALGSTSCSKGYLQGSHLCGACAPGYFLEDDGTCNACPVLKSAWDRYHTLLYILFVIMGIVAAVWAGLLLLVRLRGGTLLGGAARMLDLFVWGLISAQVISSAATVSSPSLAPLLASLFRAAAALQLQGVLLPPACTGAYPFESEVFLMGLALFAWSLCIAVYYSRRSFSLRGHLSQAGLLFGRAALTVALVLYSSSASTAVSLLNCPIQSVAVGSLAALDGGAAATYAGMATGRGATVALRVLGKNPFFVCWAGSHRAAGILAAVTLALYVAVLPVLLLEWSWKGPWLQAQLRNERGPEHDPAGCPCVRRKKDAVGGERFVKNPMWTERACRRKLGPLEHGQEKGELPTATAVRGASSSPSSSLSSRMLPDPMLQPVLGDYVPAAWYTKFADILLLLVLALLSAIVPRPVTAAHIATKAAVSCTLLLAVCAHVLLVRPYLPQQAWKTWVRALLLFDSAGCALLNAAVSALDVGLGGPHLRASVPVGSYIIFVLCCITFGVLLWRFGVSMYAGAEAEQNDLVEASKAPPAPAPQPMRPLLEIPRTKDNALPSSSVVHQQSMRFVTAPIKRRARNVRNCSRRLRQHSAALCATSGDPEAARVTCIALRDAISDALAVAEGPAAEVVGGSGSSGAPARAAALDVEEVANGVRALSDVLVRYAAHASVVQGACEGLLAAAAFASKVTNALLATTAPQGLVGALRNHGTTSDVIARASCGALAAVAASAAGALAVAEAGGVASLVSILQASMIHRCREGVCAGVGAATADACRALAELCQHEGTVQQLTGSDVIEALVGVLATATSTLGSGCTSTETETVVAASHAAQALAAVTVHEDALPRFIAAGGVPTLVALLQAGLRVPAPTSDSGLSQEQQLLLQAAVAAMATHVAEAMLSLSTTASGAAALFEAGAIPPLLQAITVPSTDDAGGARVSSKRELVLWEAACWALRGFARDREQLSALADEGAVTMLTTLLGSCSSVSNTRQPQPQGQAPSAAEAEVEIAQRVAEHARALVGALHAAASAAA